MTERLFPISGHIARNTVVLRKKKRGIEGFKYNQLTISDIERSKDKKQATQWQKLLANSKTWSERQSDSKIFKENEPEIY